jgi:outer membrane protein insertion porin family
VTSPDIVYREITLKKGDLLKASQVSKIESALKKMRIFSEVSIHLLPDANQASSKILHIRLKEADRGYLTGGPGIRNDLGIRFFSQFSYSNLWGKNHTISFSTSLNRRFYHYHFIEGRFQIDYVWPLFSLSDYVFKPSFSISRIQYFDFSADTITASFLVDKTILRDPLLVASFGYVFERIREFTDLNESSKELALGSLVPKIVLDMRDNNYSPHSGFYGLFNFDIALTDLGLLQSIAESFYRTQLRLDYYFPIWLFEDTVWFVSYRMGYAQVFGKTTSIPLLKQFRLGGINSLRGYLEQSFQITNQNQDLYNNVPELTYVNYRTELQFPFLGALKWAVFLDAANLNINQFSFGNLSYGAGFGFNYETPVGAIHLYIGFPVNPPPDIDQYVIHFSLGVI